MKENSLVKIKGDPTDKVWCIESLAENNEALIYEMIHTDRHDLYLIPVCMLFLVKSNYGKNIEDNEYSNFLHNAV